MPVGAGFFLATASAGWGGCSAVRGEMGEPRVASVLWGILVVGDTGTGTGGVGREAEITSDVT